MLLYIIGFSGAGKSALARSLAMSWHIPAYDTDAIFCQQQQMSIAEYATLCGWSAFRERESEILIGTRDLVSGFPAFAAGYSGIVACGGGIVEQPENRDFLQAERVLWLAPPWETLLERIRQQPSDFARGKSEAELWQQYQRRARLYRQCLNILGAE